MGSGGVELAERLAKRPGWKTFDKDLVEYIAENAHVRKSMVEMFDDRVQNEMDDWVVTLLDRFALGSYRYSNI
ncbi:MAG: cytidylate kinase family protein [Calditrichaeota bacterium]|nr:cytidylate kinase family protein [Calditrichota bacterium]